MKIIFETALSAGFSLLKDDQRYTFIGNGEHTCRDGRVIEMDRWTCECAVCGVPFETKSMPREIPQTRRCREHANPGLKVSTQRRRAAKAVKA